MDLQLKQRLLGATILVALAVIIVPELIKHPLELQHSVAVNTPNRPDHDHPASDSAAMTIRLPDPEPQSAAASSSVTGDASAASISAADPLHQPEQELPLAVVVPQSNERSSAVDHVADQPVSASTAQQAAAVELPKIELISRQPEYQPRPSASPSWIVQVGSFEVAKNAYALRDKLLDQQFPAYLESTEIDNRTRYRVHVGPFASKSDSEREQARLQSAANINGSIKKL